jgi:hypothetical protein
MRSSSNAYQYYHCEHGVHESFCILCNPNDNRCEKCHGKLALARTDYDRRTWVECTGCHAKSSNVDFTEREELWPK